MARRIARLISIALPSVVAAGCGTTPARFYSLDSTATADGAPATPATVMVGPVTIPASVDQPEFVVQVAPNRVEVDEFNRWVAPLNDSIARAVAGDLVVLLGTPNVASAQLANFTPAYWVTIDVQRFESVHGQAATRRGGMGGAQNRGRSRRARAAPSRASRCRVRASTRSPPRTAARSRR